VYGFADLLRATRSLPILSLCITASCAPRLRPLEGAPAPVVRLPTTGIPAGQMKYVFDWELDDTDIKARGDGVARTSHPDSARLDFFVAGGMGSGAAVLIGTELRSPGPDLMRRVVPPAPLLWAALGKLAIPPERDTVARVDGDLLRADIGRPVRWRVSFRGDTLVRLERVDGDRVVEWVDRAVPSRVRYRHETARRQLTLSIASMERASPFDASIWRF
jgi:hypothetical protein